MYLETSVRPAKFWGSMSWGTKSLMGQNVVEQEVSCQWGPKLWGTTSLNTGAKSMDRRIWGRKMGIITFSEDVISTYITNKCEVT